MGVYIHGILRGSLFHSDVLCARLGYCETELVVWLRVEDLDET